MKIEWRRPKGTGNFTDAQMAEFYAKVSEIIKPLCYKDTDDVEVDVNALSNMD